MHPLLPAQAVGQLLILTPSLPSPSHLPAPPSLLVCVVPRNFSVCAYAAAAVAAAAAAAVAAPPRRYALNQYLSFAGGASVLSVNYRSGVGYGRAFRLCEGTDRKCGWRGGLEYDDVAAARAWVEATLKPSKVYSSSAHRRVFPLHSNTRMHALSLSLPLARPYSSMELHVGRSASGYKPA